MTRRTPLRAAMLAVVFVQSGASAQTDRVTLRMMPVPNQTVHARSVQETQMEMVPDPAATVTAPAPAANVAMRIATATTMTVGAPSDTGEVEARTVFDEFSMETMVNGQPVPVPASSQSFVGKTLTATYDEQGKLTHISSDAPELQQWLDVMGGMLSGGLDLHAGVTLGIGETATVPMKIPLPIGGPGAAALTTSSESTLTLVSIDQDGADRIAHFTTKIITRVDQESAASRSTVAMDMKSALTGTIDWNLTRNIMKATELHGTMDGGVRVPGISLPGMRMHGTMKMTTAAQ